MSTENGGTSFGDALIGALEEAVAHEGGERAGARVRRVQHTARRTRIVAPPVYTPEQIRDIRHALSMSQSVFAELLHASASAVRAWEQGVRKPDGPTRRLLQVAEVQPDALMRTVEGGVIYALNPGHGVMLAAERPLRPYGAPAADKPDAKDDGEKK